MLVCRSCTQALRHAAPFSRTASVSRRSLSHLPKDLLQTTSPVAERLQATRIWNYGRTYGGKTRQRAAVKGDRSRVNVVSDKLCDDILGYIGPSLERHRGCDLVDIYPGAGVWSQKLHDAIQPRSHVLMEPDESLYTPFLEPLLKRPGTSLVPRSGIVWKDLMEVLSALPHQQQRDSGASLARNDSLLVTMNLASYPKKKYRSFRSVALLILYQLLSAVRSQSFFQQYGQVRILLWVNDDVKGTFLPRSASRRRNSSMTADFSCDWLTEVAGLDSATESVVSSSTARGSTMVRDRRIDLDSAYATLQRMRNAGISLPKGRETELFREMLQDANAAGQAGTQAQSLDRPFLQELRSLESANAVSEFAKGTKELLRLKDLRYKLKITEAANEKIFSFLSELDRIASLRGQGSITEEKLAEMDRSWNEKLSQNTNNFMSDFILARDNLHLFRQDPPVLMWDRRSVEPLAVQSSEFFPNVECCLLDLQPRTMHPLLRETGPGSSRAGDVFELICSAVMGQSLKPLSKALESIWPGAAEGVLPHCPSLKDPARGGLPGTGHAELTPRILNETQWMEILDAWMKWPFRPSYNEMIARLADDSEAPDPGEEGGNRVVSDCL